MLRRVAAAAVCLLAIVLVSGGAASADAPAQQGWWEGPTPLDPVLDVLPDIGLDLGEVSAIDVPADGLLVQGNNAGDAPAAYAALVFDVGADEIAGPLRLVPESAAASVPGSEIQVCPLDEPSFTPAQGGPPAGAPSYDCFAVVAATTDDDGAFVVDVTTLRRDEHVAVAILPATPSTRVVFEKPADDALPLRDAGADPAQTPPSDDGSGGDDTATPTVPGVAGSGGNGDAGMDAPTPTNGRAPEQDGDDQLALPTAATSTQGAAGRAVVLGLIAALGAGLWVSAGHLGLRREAAA